MKFEPHNYQKYAIDYIKTHEQCAVFLDMGLGKTVITLTALKDMLKSNSDVKKILVIAPVRVAKFTWPDEAEKWDHLKELRLSVAAGTPKQRIDALNADADIYVINRENVHWLVNQSGIPFDFDTVVIDELSSFKNYGTNRYKALMKVRPKIKRIIALTGTPASNGYMDLFAEFRLVDMGERLGKYVNQYRFQYFDTDREVAPGVYSYILKPGADREIFRKISDISISMDAGSYLEMPEKIVSEYPVHLSRDEMDFYNDRREEFLENRRNITTDTAGLGGYVTMLCQIAGGAIYKGEQYEEIHTKKLDALEDIIEAASGKPVLVAFWFRHELERIKKKLGELGVTFDLISSGESVKAWNEGKLQVGLIHPQSAGHGLNLQEGGSTIVWFSPIFSLELYQQTNARLWRQGQKDKTVVIQHIIAEGTIDRRIMDVLGRKDVNQKALLDAVKADTKGK